MSLIKTLNVRHTNLIPAVISRLLSSNPDILKYETLEVSVPKKNVFHVELNRPNKLNSFTGTTWKELNSCFSALSSIPECRAIVLSGRGKHFTAGIDFKSLMEGAAESQDIEDIARRVRYFETMIAACQDGISALEECAKPVLAVVHSACIGAGVDLITAADMRYCTQDAWFQVKEVDVGLAADVGTLQRLPKVIGNTSTVRELCYTARKVDSKEALDLGLVSKVFPDQETRTHYHISHMGQCIRFYNKLPNNIKDLSLNKFKAIVKANLCCKAYYKISDYVNDNKAWDQVALTQHD